MIIAIDGPSASGKGTVARQLAKYFGLPYLDTGALYRGVTLKLLREGFTPEHTSEAVRIAQEFSQALQETPLYGHPGQVSAANADPGPSLMNRKLDPRFRGDVRILLSDPELRSERVSRAVSPVSAIPEVRQHLLDLQRQFASQPGGAVLDGRDIASVIAPQAEVKIYVTATPEKRAERRFKELQSSGQAATYEAILKDMQMRDARDASRNVAPAHQTADAILLDNTDLSIDQAFATALQIVKEKTGQA